MVGEADWRTDFDFLGLAAIKGVSSLRRVVNQ